MQHHERRVHLAELHLPCVDVRQLHIKKRDRLCVAKIVEQGHILHPPLRFVTKCLDIFGLRIYRLKGIGNVKHQNAIRLLAEHRKLAGKGLPEHRHYSKRVAVLENIFHGAAVIVHVCLPEVSLRMRYFRICNCPVKIV